MEVAKVAKSSILDVTAVLDPIINSDNYCSDQNSLKCIIQILQQNYKKIWIVQNKSINIILKKQNFIICALSNSQKEKVEMRFTNPNNLKNTLYLEQMH